MPDNERTLCPEIVEAAFALLERFPGPFTIAS